MEKRNKKSHKKLMNIIISMVTNGSSNNRKKLLKLRFIQLNKRKCCWTPKDSVSWSHEHQHIVCILRRCSKRSPDAGSTINPAMSEIIGENTQTHTSTSWEGSHLLTYFQVIARPLCIKRISVTLHSQQRINERNCLSINASTIL